MNQIHFVTVVTITDRCDFERVLERRAFLGNIPTGTLAWGEERCAVLLAEYTAVNGEHTAETFDPTYEVETVKLA